MDGNSQLIIKGRFQQKQIENVLRRYIKEYVTCHTCRSPDTILQKDTRLFFLQCETCGSRCSVASIKSGFQVGTSFYLVLERIRQSIGNLIQLFSPYRLLLENVLQFGPKLPKNILHLVPHILFRVISLIKKNGFNKRKLSLQFIYIRLKPISTALSTLISKCKVRLRPLLQNEELGMHVIGTSSFSSIDGWYER